MIEKDKIIVGYANFPFVINHHQSNTTLLEAQHKQIDYTKIDQFKNVNFTNTDRVYFCKSSTTPRYKIKDYCEKNKITLNKTNRVGLADAFVINYEDINHIKKLRFDTTYREIPIDGVKVAFNTNIPADNEMRKANKLLHPVDNYYGDRNLNTTFTLKEIASMPSVKAIQIASKYISIFEILEIFFKDPTKYKLVFDQTISGQINDYNLDIATFDSLYKMFSSSNQDDNYLAAEILSNCDREKNKIGVLLLLNKFWSKLGGKTNTNFKSLIEHFKNYGSSKNYNDGTYIGDNPINNLSHIVKNETLEDEDKHIINQFLKYHFREMLGTKINQKIIIDEFKTTFV